MSRHPVDPGDGIPSPPPRRKPKGAGDCHEKRRHELREVRRIWTEKEILREQRQSRSGRHEQRQSLCLKGKITARKRADEQSGGRDDDQ